MRNLLMTSDATEYEQENIKLEIKSIIGFGLGMLMSALGMFLLLCSWVTKLCKYCDGEGCSYCYYDGYSGMEGIERISPWLGVLILAGGIISFSIVSYFKNKHNIPYIPESNSSVVGTIVVVGLILGFIDVFVFSNSFNSAYNGMWSFIVGKMNYVSAIIAAFLWIFVLILPIGMTAGRIVGSVAYAEYQVTHRRKVESEISTLYKKVFLR